VLIVLIHNDGTGEPEHIGNYDVEVRINAQTLWRGRVIGHNRYNGWPKLLETVSAIAKAEGK
jgi:hypothetical protein